VNQKRLRNTGLEYPKKLDVFTGNCSNSLVNDEGNYKFAINEIE